MTNRRPSIVIIGAGNVAYHLSLNLQKHCKIRQVIGHSSARASELSKRLHVPYSCKLAEIDPQADLYILAIQDDALPDVIDRLPAELKFVVHTSGSTPLGVFKYKFTRVGVFYPLQTITRDTDVDFRRVPILLECSDEEGLNLLKALAGKISDRVLEINSEDRELLHIAAVFANNFSNFMLTVAHDILGSNGLDFDLLRPLLDETYYKLQRNLPAEIQTGPARRNDVRILEEHSRKLEKYRDYQKMYNFVSRYIVDYYKSRE